MYAIDDPKKRAVGFKLSEGMEVPAELASRFKFARQKSKLAGPFAVPTSTSKTTTESVLRGKQGACFARAGDSPVLGGPRDCSEQRRARLSTGSLLPSRTSVR
jgi:hypothetical protein